MFAASALVCRSALDPVAYGEERQAEEEGTEQPEERSASRIAQPVSELRLVGTTQQGYGAVHAVVEMRQASLDAAPGRLSAGRARPAPESGPVRLARTGTIWEGANPAVRESDRCQGQHNEERQHGTDGAKAVAGQRPVESQNQPFARRRGGGLTAHFHLAVVEVGGTGLVLGIFLGLAKLPVQRQ